MLLSSRNKFPHNLLYVILSKTKSSFQSEFLIKMVWSSFTLLEVICFTDVDTDERHELKLGEPLSCRGRQREQVPKVSDLRVDQVATQFARPFRRLARIEAIF